MVFSPKPPKKRIIKPPPPMDTADEEEETILIALITTLVILLKYEEEEPKQAPKREPIPIPPGHFSLDNFGDEEVRRMMRFSKAQVRQLAEIFQLWRVPWRSRYKPDSEIALSLVLVRLSWPERLFRLIRAFHKSEAWLSTVYNDVCVYLFEEYRDLICWHPMLNDYKRLRKYAKAIARKLGAGPPLFWGFIDGTFRGICRPEQDQGLLYSGYKKEHGIKWQGIVTPDGILTLQGPWLGKVNDWKMYEESGVQARMRQVVDPSLSMLPFKLTFSCFSDL